MTDAVLFSDRRHAGRELAAKLLVYAARPDVVVLGLPRGGVPVATEVAKALRAPLDVLLVRKLGVPGHEELAMGAIASGGVLARNESVLAELGISDALIRLVADRELAELSRRERVYRHGRPAIEVLGKTVIVVDDGLATGSTMRAAVTALRARAPARIVSAAPVGSRDTCQQLRQLADDCVCAAQPNPLRAVGNFYRDFAQTTDDQVVACLDAADAELARVRARNAGANAALQRERP